MQATMRVTVVYAPAPPALPEIVELELQAEATVNDAVLRSGVLERVAENVRNAPSFSVFGEPAAPSRPLQAGDRVEILRPLLLDPVEQRRLRQRRSGQRRIKRA